MDGMEDVLKEFLVEAHESLDQFDRDLVALEQDPSPAILGQIFRTIHTIKGTSGFLALHKLGAIAHVGENLLALLRDGRRQVTAEVANALLAMADALRDILGHVEREAGEGPADHSALVQRLTELAAEAPLPVASPAMAAPGPAVAAHGVGAGPRSSLADASLRVDVTLLDKLMNLVGELVLARNQLLQCAGRRDEAVFLGTCQRLSLVTTELQEGVMKTRMQPIGSIWTKFPRLVRDVAQACGKSVRIEMEGHDTELDKTIIESIKDPLVHALRNAVDHGVEPPARRRELGKPEEGCIRLRAFHEGGQVNIEIADDGGGIDPARIRAKAAAGSIVPPERLARLDDREVLQLIMLPGFSTAEKVTSVSGRGVGMDVVKTNIERIGGTLDIHSEVGRGTTLRIRIPLTLAIVPALIVGSGQDRFAIPQVNLLELVRLGGGDRRIEQLHGQPFYRLRGQLLPVVHLEQQLGLPPRGAGEAVADEACLVVLRAEHRQFGLVVESVLDTEEIVVKPLGRQLEEIPVFAGAAIMGDGRVALILDALGLGQRAGVVGGAAEGGGGPAVNAAAGGGDGAAALLLVGAGGGHRLAVPLDSVARLEELAADAVERSAAGEVVQYRGEILPLVRLGPALGLAAAAAPQERLRLVVVRTAAARHCGLVVEAIHDVVREPLELQHRGRRPGVLGTAALQGRVTDVVDVEGVLAAGGVA